VRFDPDPTSCPSPGPTVSKAVEVGLELAPDGVADLTLSARAVPPARGGLPRGVLTGIIARLGARSPPRSWKRSMPHGRAREQLLGAQPGASRSGPRPEGVEGGSDGPSGSPEVVWSTTRRLAFCTSPESHRLPPMRRDRWAMASAALGISIVGMVRFRSPSRLTPDVLSERLSATLTTPAVEPAQLAVV
jgi:hypothetical protein